MLNMVEFKRLSDKEQADATFNGIFLDDRKEGKHTVQLYRVDDYYVEVFYDQANNEITGIRPFNHSSGLVPYVNLKTF